MRGFWQTNVMKESNIQFVWRTRRSLGELRDEIEEERGEMFFVTIGCSFGIKCHTVNVKGGGERRERRDRQCGSSGDNASP